MGDPSVMEKLGIISDRLARMEERQIAANEREVATMARCAVLEKRISEMESARSWALGAMAAVGALFGWFANFFHVGGNRP